MSNHSVNQISSNNLYLKEYSMIYYPYMIFNFCGFLFGTIGNLLIIGSIVLNKKLILNPAYILMLNLSLSDIGISMFVQTFTNIGIIFGEEFYLYKPLLCEFLASFCLVACGTSLFNMLFLAINRYINICNNSMYSKVFTLRNTIIICVIAWIAGIVVDLPNFLGWGGHFFDKKSANCMWNRLASRSYSIFFPTTAIFIPCVCILLCYVRIFHYAYKSKKKTQKYSKHLNQSLKVAKSLFASFFLFTICWVPYGTLVAYDFEDKMPMSFHAITTFMAHINSTLNPILYALFNPTFRRSLKNLLRYFFDRNSILMKSSIQYNSTHTLQ